MITGLDIISGKVSLPFSDDEIESLFSPRLEEDTIQTFFPGMSVCDMVSRVGKNFLRSRLLHYSLHYQSICAKSGKLDSGLIV